MKSESDIQAMVAFAVETYGGGILLLITLESSATKPSFTIKRTMIGQMSSPLT